MTDNEEIETLSLDVAAATEAPLLVTSGTLDALVNDYADARNAREAVSEQEKTLRATEEQAEAALFDAMERLNLRSVQHARGRFGLNDLAWASVSDEDAARQWAEAEMPELLLLNRQRLSVIVRQFLKGERDSMPPGTEFKTSRKITWRRT